MTFCLKKGLKHKPKHSKHLNTNHRPQWTDFGMLKFFYDFLAFSVKHISLFFIHWKLSQKQRLGVVYDVVLLTWVHILCIIFLSIIVSFVCIITSFAFYYIFVIYFLCQRLAESAEDADLYHEYNASLEVSDPTFLLITNIFLKGPVQLFKLLDNKTWTKFG